MLPAKTLAENPLPIASALFVIQNTCPFQQQQYTRFSLGA